MATPFFQLPRSKTEEKSFFSSLSFILPIQWVSTSCGIFIHTTFLLPLRLLPYSHELWSFAPCFDTASKLISVLLPLSTIKSGLHIAARMILWRLGQILLPLCSMLSNCSSAYLEKKPMHINPSIMAHKPSQVLTSVPVWLMSYFQVQSSLFFEHDKHVSVSRPLHPLFLLPRVQLP